MERRTHYEILEVSESASLEVVRAAHRPLVIDREVELVGEGLSGGVVIEAAEGTAVHVQGAGVTLRNLTVHGRGPGEDSHAVSIRGSRARLENCAVSSASGTGILVTKGAQVIVHGCRVEQAGDHRIGL